MGPLNGVKVIEIGAIGPAPFCAMMLADMGADVVRVDRASARLEDPDPVDSTLRNRRSIALDLKNAAAVESLFRVLERADALIEGFRPGVAERLGIGPEACLARNRRLVYGRMTGWGQTGPLASAAGRDINYISITGALHLIGESGRRPMPPLNLVGDMGGGGMLLLAGILAALIEAGRSGRGQVVDAAMVDGALALLAYQYSQRAEDPGFPDETGESLLAGAAPFYGTYETRDGRYVAVGAIDPHAYATLLEIIGVDPSHRAAAHSGGRQHWATARTAIAEALRQRTRDEWLAITEGVGCCLTPVLSLGEATVHPHIRSREAIIDVEGVTQAAPAPRFSRTSTGPVRAPHRAGSDTCDVLREAGFSESELEELRSSGALT